MLREAVFINFIIILDDALLLGSYVRDNLLKIDAIAFYLIRLSHCLIHYLIKLELNVGNSKLGTLGCDKPLAASKICRSQIPTFVYFQFFI